MCDYVFFVMRNAIRCLPSLSGLVSPLSPENARTTASRFPVRSLWIFQAKVILFYSELRSQFSLL